MRDTKEFRELKLASHRSGLKHQIDVLTDLIGRTQKLIPGTKDKEQKVKLEGLSSDSAKLKKMLEEELVGLDKKLEKL